MFYAAYVVIKWVRGSKIVIQWHLDIVNSISTEKRRNFFGPITHPCIPYLRFIILSAMMIFPVQTTQRPKRAKKQNEHKNEKLPATKTTIQSPTQQKNKIATDGQKTQRTNKPYRKTDRQKGEFRAAIFIDAGEIVGYDFPFYGKRGGRAIFPILEGGRSIPMRESSFRGNNIRWSKNDDAGIIYKHSFLPNFRSIYVDFIIEFRRRKIPKPETSRLLQSIRSERYI